jgi:hypothetical protein
MAFEFDTVTITFMDPETQDSFIYFMGYDGGDDYINEDDHHKKFFEGTGLRFEPLEVDSKYKDIREKIDKIQNILYL